MSTNSSFSSFSVKNITKDDQTVSSSNKMIQLKDNKKNFESPIMKKKEQKINKINNTISSASKKNKNSSSVVKSRILYENAKKKLINNSQYGISNKTNDINKILNTTFSNGFKKSGNIYTHHEEKRKNDKKLKFSNLNISSKNIDFNKKKRESLPLYKNENKLNHNINRNNKNIIRNNYAGEMTYGNDVSTERGKRHSSLVNINRPILTLNDIALSMNQMKEKRSININRFKRNNISSKEQAFYILSTSPVLRLTEQFIFSRATKNIKNSLKVEYLLKNHNIFLNAKVNELQNEINLCEKRIKSPFVASKIADITLNFITSTDEQEFKDFDIIENNKDEINYYNNYIKLLYILFNENYDDNLDIKSLKNNLFEKVKEKGFYYLRDYLYHIFIAKKEEFNIIPKIEIINNEILKNCPKLLNFHETLKICKFAAFSNYLIKEIVIYANNMKDTIELKFRAKNLLDIVLDKINRIKNKNKKSTKKTNKN